jgi:hypothetical protein
LGGSLIYHAFIVCNKLFSILNIYSAYFNKTVTVTILKNTQVTLLKNEQPDVLARFQREVNLLCNNKIVCNAKSQVLIKDQKIFDLVVKEGVGIGQLFRYVLSNYYYLQYYLLI